MDAGIDIETAQEIADLASEVIVNYGFQILVADKTVLSNSVCRKCAYF